MVAERLTPARLTRLSLDPRPVLQLVAQHGHGRDHSLKIWALLVLDVWADQTRTVPASAVAAVP